MPSTRISIQTTKPTKFTIDITWKSLKYWQQSRHTMINRLKRRIYDEEHFYDTWHLVLCPFLNYYRSRINAKGKTRQENIELILVHLHTKKFLFLCISTSWKTTTTTKTLIRLPFPKMSVVVVVLPYGLPQKWLCDIIKCLPAKTFYRFSCLFACDYLRFDCALLKKYLLLGLRRVFYFLPHAILRIDIRFVVFIRLYTLALYTNTRYSG